MSLLRRLRQQRSMSDNMLVKVEPPAPWPPPPAPKDWEELHVPGILKANIAGENLRAFQKGPVRVLVSREPHTKSGELLWHISISCADRNPTWEEIRAARYDFVPDEVTMAVYLPPRSQYVNVHEFCFHLWEVEGE